MHVNDLKHAALLTLLGLTEGHITDLEDAWLASEGYTSWEDLAHSLGFSSPSAWLSSLGYTGHINDQWYEYWLSGGGGLGPPPEIDLKEGLVIYYDCNDLITTDAHSGINATQIGAGVISLGVGKINSALQFADGENSFLATEPFQTTLQNGFSFVVWATPIDDSGATYTVFCLGGEDPSDEQSLKVEIRRDDVTVVIQNTLFEQIGESAAGVTPGILQFFAVTFDPLTLSFKVYLNGELAITSSSFSNGSEFFSPERFNIGARRNTFNADNFFVGLTDLIGIWEIELSPEKILALYNNGDGLEYIDL